MIKYEMEALEYISKLSEGGMRDALTLLDKCLAYSTDLTTENVVKALGTVDYEIMFDLTDALIFNRDNSKILTIIEDLYNQGKDLKQFIKQYMVFLLDVHKYCMEVDWSYMQLPELDAYKKKLDSWFTNIYAGHTIALDDLLDTVLKLSNDIKYSNSVKYDIEATLMLFAWEE